MKICKKIYNEVLFCNFTMKIVFLQFFFSEIPLHPLACPANQVEESFELIHSVDEVAEENDRLET